MQVLITNNGTHSPEKWAVATAEHICPIDASAMSDDRLLAAKKLQVAIAAGSRPRGGVEGVSPGEAWQWRRHGLVSTGLPVQRIDLVPRGGAVGAGHVRTAGHPWP